MRHKKRGRKLGRNSAHRKALMRNMATSLLIHDRIQTTDAKAKELRGYIERIITLARKANRSGGENGDAAKSVHYRRLALKNLRLPRIDSTSKEERGERKEILDKLFVELAERFMDRPGGYTRVLKVGNRRGDGAPMSIIEFVEETMDEKPAKKKTKKKSTPKKKAAPKETAKPEAEEEKAEEVEAAPEEPEVTEDAPAEEATTEEAPAEEAPAEEAPAEEAPAEEAPAEEAPAEEEKKEEE